MTDTPDFLTRIIEQKRVRLAHAKSLRSLAAVRAEALSVREAQGCRSHALRAALAREQGYNVIAEIKRASPSLGDIRRDAAPADVALRYETGGAAAISVLTEEDHFKGALEDLQAVRAATRLPLLRKDFIFEEWQLYEAAAARADALLLIVAALDDATLARLRQITEDELGMDALVEVHTLEELRRAAGCGANIIGVNNRNLHTFAVSLETSVELIDAAPPGALLVSESGLRTHADLRRLKSLGYHGFLIGETLMRAGDPSRALRELLSEQTADG
ncbi:MAG TPA: indole-3-glycerol phosphate synthase TrpC [Pyrinomonadaceae bacterium]|nr:indole-3-glycerol phosphate synthase TrpC [Pyrinomonadaceae bacterium]